MTDLKTINLFSRLSLEECVCRLKSGMVEEFMALPIPNWGPRQVVGTVNADDFEIQMRTSYGMYAKKSLHGRLSSQSHGTAIDLQFEDPWNTDWMSSMLSRRGPLSVWIVLVFLFYAFGADIKSMPLHLVATVIPTAIIFFPMVWWTVRYERPYIRFLKHCLNAVEGGPPGPEKQAIK